MPNVKLKIGMDNRIKPGTQTLDELIAVLQGQGVGTNAANPVFDPVTGKLIRVEVNLPDTASEQATAAINAHAGVATASPPLPTPALIIDLTNIALATILLPLISGTGFATEINVVPCTPEGAATALLGRLVGSDPPTANVYQDGSTNPDVSVGTHSRIELINGDTVADLVFPPSEITLSFDGGDLLLTNSASITVPKRIAGFAGVLKDYYVDAAGNMYHAGESVNGTIIPRRTYEQAVALGAV